MRHSPSWNAREVSCGKTDNLSKSRWPLHGREIFSRRILRSTPVLIDFTGTDRAIPWTVREGRAGHYLSRCYGPGRKNRGDNSELFNMAYLAIRGSGAVNGVSRLHGEVSRQLFAPLFPRWPQAEVPIAHVTNGVHVPSWDSAEADELWTELRERPLAGARETWTKYPHPDRRLWQFRTAARDALVEYVREQISRQLRRRRIARNGRKAKDVV